ncbi:MAG: hypothetical protein R3C68_06755 [Myxococcota bacterium]
MLERAYIQFGIKQKHALVSVFELASGEHVTIVNGHLDTAGGNVHRTRQIEAVAQALGHGPQSQRLMICGDTNVFSWTALRGLRSKERILAPMARFGARDHGDAPTHFFARQDEPCWTHQLLVWLGKLGIDLPRRTDVLCTNMNVQQHGQISTPQSDHDLIWGRVALGSV